MPLPPRLRKYSTTRPYIPKRKSPELELQLWFCHYLRKNFPGIMFHSDYSAGLGLTMNQARINKGLQYDSGMPDIYIFAPGRLNKKGERYIGLVIEIKKEGTTIMVKRGQNKGRLTSDPHIRQQAGILHRFIDAGWCANFASGRAELIRLVNWYFERPVAVNLFEQI